MSSIGVTGNCTSSGRLRPLRPAGRLRRRHAHRWALRRTTRLKCAKPRSCAAASVRRTAPYEASLSARMTTTVGSSSTGPPSVSCPPPALPPARPTRLPPPSPSSALARRRAAVPWASTATTSRSSARSAPGSAAGADGQPDRLRRPLELRPEVDQHHEERDELEDDVEQRRQVQVERLVRLRIATALIGMRWLLRWTVSERSAAGDSRAARAPCGDPRPRRPADAARGRRGRTARGATRPPCATSSESRAIRLRNRA